MMSYIYIHTGLKIKKNIYIYTIVCVFFLLKYPWSKKNGSAFQLFFKYIIKQMPWVFKTPCVINIIIKSFRKELFDGVICETSSES